MAPNPPNGDDHRIGAVHNPKNDRWMKRNDDTGRFLDQKADKTLFKGVRKEK